MADLNIDSNLAPDRASDINNGDLSLTAAVNDAHMLRLLQMGRVSAVCAIAFGGIIPLAALTSIIMHLVSFFCATPLLLFYNANYSGLPVVLMLLCYAGLLRSFFLGKPSRLATIIRSILTIAIFLGCLCSGPIGLLVYFSSAITWVSACWLGTKMRAAVPESFRFDRALMALLVGSIPSLAYMAIVTLGIWRPQPPEAAMIAHFSPTYLFSVSIFLALSLTLQGHLLARCARTGAAKPLILLSALLNSPILLAAMAMPIGAAFCSELSTCTGAFFATSLALPFISIGATALGAWTGAKSNAMSHELKLEGGHSLRLDGGGFSGSGHG